jgi:predicted transcriptional regulator with HTH domain
LRIICYPENHHLSNISDQIRSTKDDIRNILQNLDKWTLRESLLELKLTIVTQKVKDFHYVSYIKKRSLKIITFFLFEKDHLVKYLSKKTVDL